MPRVFFKCILNWICCCSVIQLCLILCKPMNCSMPGFPVLHYLHYEYFGLISFRSDWFDDLFVKGTLKGLPQHHSSKASILWCSAFFMVQLSHPYMNMGKTIALTIRTFVSKVVSLLFNMLSIFVIAFLPRSKHLLISWLQSPSTVILEPKKV